MAVLAARKGYSFIPWMFAGGLLGLIIVLLPRVDDPELSKAERDDVARSGNRLGAVLAAASLVLAVSTNLR